MRMFSATSWARCLQHSLHRSLPSQHRVRVVCAKGHWDSMHQAFEMRVFARRALECSIPTSVARSMRIGSAMCRFTQWCDKIRSRLQILQMTAIRRVSATRASRIAAVRDAQGIFVQAGLATSVHWRSERVQYYCGASEGLLNARGDIM